MAKPVDHSLGSSVATVGLQTGKGVLWGIAGMGTLAALLGGAITAVLGAAFFTFSWPAVIVGALASGLVGAVSGAATGATIGGAVGAVVGGVGVAREKASFQRRMGMYADHAQQSQQAAYMAGAQDGQAHLIQQIQAHAEAEQAAAQQQSAGAFAQREVARREAAAAQTQLGGKA